MTTKKRGRGRPKKTDKTAEKIPVAKYLEGARKSLDIKTEEVALSNNLKLARDLGAQKPIREEVQTVMEADFRIVIDNETAEKDVRFLQNGDQGLALVMLDEHYLENF